MSTLAILSRFAQYLGDSVDISLFLWAVFDVRASAFVFNMFVTGRADPT